MTDKLIHAEMVEALNVFVDGAGLPWIRRDEVLALAARPTEVPEYERGFRDGESKQAILEVQARERFLSTVPKDVREAHKTIQRLEKERDEAKARPAEDGLREVVEALCQYNEGDEIPRQLLDAARAALNRGKP